MNTAIKGLEYVTIGDIEHHARGHFFDAGAKRFFSSRMPQGGWKLNDKAYFVTSEQFIDYVNHYTAARAYTVRCVDYKTGDIVTIGEFNKFTRSQAQAVLECILAGKWVIESVKQDYTIWLCHDRETGKHIYQVTKGEIPTGEAGYFDKYAMLQLKNL